MQPWYLFNGTFHVQQQASKFQSKGLQGTLCLQKVQQDTVESVDSLTCGIDFGHFLCWWVGPYCGQQASNTDADIVNINCPNSHFALVMGKRKW